MGSPQIENTLEQLELELRESEVKSWRTVDGPVYIYGAGNVGKDIFRVLRNAGISVAGFLDRKARLDAVWQDVPILTPDHAALSAHQRQRSQVILGIFNPYTGPGLIVSQLKTLGYGQVTSFLDIHDQFASELGDRFWLTSRKFYLGHQQEIRAAGEIWSDDKSRDLYTAVLKFRVTKSDGILSHPDLEDQYFPAGLPPWPSPVRFIDCGAFDGDTLRLLLDGRMEIEAIAAFEPDPANFASLAASMRSRARLVKEVLALFPCGVSCENSQIRFSSGKGSASCASVEGNTVIQCVRLDDALPAFRPNAIKMDIEGVELDALLGARQIIQEYRPHLALSVYHRPEHLWTIPLLAQTWLKGGRHYLRLHAHNAFELIYYWFP